jgi:phosphoenolpyruvate carboxykinase (GTP)
MSHKELNIMTIKDNRFDIAGKIGGITSKKDAMAFFENKLDAVHLSRIRYITTPEVLVKIANAAAMCEPDDIFINSGTEEDRQVIRDLALEKREEAPLPMDSHTIHFDLKEEQGRIIDRTFYIVNEDEPVSSLANKKLRHDAFMEIKEKMAGIMRGKTMIVGFYSRGPIGAPASNPALEITSSAYVSHSAEILYRTAYNEFDREINRLKHFFTNIHSEGLNRAEDLPHARVFMDRKFQTTYSFNCTYAGNTLLLKKGNHRFAVDKVIYENRGNELAEHMFITGIEADNGQVTWFAGAAPSGCGKTTTAMAGHHFVGDDLAQMWISGDGAIRSINPECGIFGIVEDVNQEGDPKLMEVLRNKKAEVIWSNVLIDEKGVPQWTGNGEPAPEKGFNFQGDWKQGMTDKNGKPIPMSHPNARCTLSSSFLANYSPMAEDPNGVETLVITYSGRDSDTMPPIWVAKNPDHGVAIGACIVSAATATEVGATGVKRAPWANAPFIPGPLGDYMEAQFLFFNNPKIRKDKRPVMAGLNYFLTHEARGGNSKKLLGEKRDVKVWLTWLAKMARREVPFILTPIGRIPTYEVLEKLFTAVIDKQYSRDLYNKQFSLYIDNILLRIDLQVEAYGKEPNIPEKLFTVLNEQREGLLSLKAAFGSVATPDNLIQFNQK